MGEDWGQHGPAHPCAKAPMPAPVPVQLIQPIRHPGMSLLPRSRCGQDSRVMRGHPGRVGWSHHHAHRSAVGHGDSELGFCKPVLTSLIITVLIRELSQPCMIRLVSYGGYCQGNVNEGWHSPPQQPSGMLELCLRPKALAAHQGDPVCADAAGKDAAQLSPT